MKKCIRLVLYSVPIKCSKFGVYYIDVKNTHECYIQMYMKFDNVRISITCKRYKCVI